MYKKLYVFVLVAVLTASYVQAQISIGARAGFSLTNYSISLDGKKPDKDDKSKMKPGFQIGVTGEYALNDAIAFQSGLIFATQGCRYKSSGDDEDGKWESKLTMNVNYLQIPVNALYQLDLGDMKLVLQAGPCIGLALGGKSKSEETFGGRTETDERKIEIGSEPGQMKRLDLGLGLGAGLQFDKIRVGLGYNFGLTSVSNVDKYSQRNNALTLSLTYLFGM
jgi:hypothetical protein